MLALLVFMLSGLLMLFLSVAPVCAEKKSSAIKTNGAKWQAGQFTVLYTGNTSGYTKPSG